jgi:hypothetical protein
MDAAWPFTEFTNAAFTAILHRGKVAISMDGNRTISREASAVPILLQGPVRIR